ncbi:MAG: cysteine-S-conjugate beta-lyase [Eubacteriales bacterium]|nr:cysteine-S-conjugate beta-lyase [Eubacteriales bacterium]MDN5363368.1 cysteine-S-conjugate beta-lyase [Eubacteriales bacterium]
MAFELPDREKVFCFMRAVKLSLKAVSLGGVESILSYPATMSHAAVPPEERRRLGIGDGLVRLSVGLEAPEDLQEDLERALQQAGVEG